MKNILIFCILTLSSNFALAGEVLDISKIAGKNEKEVSNYLGNPISCSSSKYGKKCQYKKGETEIIFINKKADWITVEAIDNIPFNENAISALGLKTGKPSFSSSNALRWESKQNLLEVSIFKGVSNCDYAYIKVQTK